jgi:hypothetical protein
MPMSTSTSLVVRKMLPIISMAVVPPEALPEALSLQMPPAQLQFLEALRVVLTAGHPRWTLASPSFQATW